MIHSGLEGTQAAKSRWFAGQAQKIKYGRQTCRYHLLAGCAVVWRPSGASGRPEHGPERDEREGPGEPGRPGGPG